MEYLDSYDYVIVNDDLDRATEALAAILLAGRYRRNRKQSQIAQVLGGFPPARDPHPARDVPEPDQVQTSREQGESTDATDS